MGNASKEGLSIQKNLAWNSVGNLVYLFSQWLLTYIVTNTLGFESAGIYSLSVSVSSSFYMVASYTMRNFQVSDVTHVYADETYVRSRYLTSLLSIVMCLGFAVVSAYPTNTILCIVFYMFFKASEAISDVYQGVMQVRLRMDYIGKSFILKGIIELLLFYAALLFFRSITTAVGVLFLSSYALVLLYDRPHAQSFYTPQVNGLRAIASLLKECLPSAVYGLFFMAAGQLPRIFLEGQLGTEALGFYSSIAMPVLIIQVSASFIFSPLATPLAESLERGNIRRFKKIIVQVFIVIALLALVGVVGFSLLGTWFYTLLFGEKIVPYTFLAVPLTICSVLVALSWFLTTVLTVMRELKVLLVLGGVTLAIVAIGTTPFLITFGMNGATLIYVVALIAFNLASLIQLARKIPRSSEHPVSL